MKKVLYFLLVVCVSIKAPNVIDNLASAFQNISIQKTEKDSYPLLGPKLVGKKYNNENIIIDSDEKRKIYQIRVIDQSSISGGRDQCGYHAQRNVLYFVDIIKSSFKDFDKIYGQMFNEKSFLDWNKVVSEVAGCERTELGITITQQQLQEIIKKLSDSFLTNVADTRILNAYLFNYEEDFEFYKEKIQKYELGVIDRDKKAASATVLAGFYFMGNKGREDVLFLNDIKYLDNFIVPIKLDVNNNDVSHATTLVVHKYNNELEYLFADSWKNQKFSVASKGNIKNTILGVVDLFSLSSEQFTHNLIRVTSIMLMESYVQEWHKFFYFFEMSEKESFNTNEFYKKFYKKSVDDRMKIIAKEFKKVKEKIMPLFKRLIKNDFEEKFKKIEEYLEKYVEE